MSCVVVDDEFIGTFEHLQEVLRLLTIGVNDTGYGHSLAASTHAYEYPSQLRLYADRP
jgi:hypothetical protein